MPEEGLKRPLGSAFLSFFPDDLKTHGRETVKLTFVSSWDLHAQLAHFSTPKQLYFFI